MRHVRMLGLCLVAVFAVAAVAASSALAGPEWGKCEAKAGGNYKNANCTEKAKPKGSGSYEWRKASEVAAKRTAEGKSANVPFTGHNVGSGGVLTTGGLVCEKPTEVYYHQTTRRHCIEEGYKPEYFGEEGISVECTAETNTGETSGKSGVANVHVVFTGCLLFGSAPCNSQGAEEGEVRVNLLKGKLGWLNKGTKEVGVMLEPGAKKGAFAEFYCAGGAIKTAVGVGNNKTGAFYLSSGCIGSCESATPEEEKHGGYDEIISPITPVNAMTNEFTQVYKANAVHENEPRSFEGKHISQLEDYIDVQGSKEFEPDQGIMWSPASEEVTNVNTPEEEGEIKA